ncbi:MAG: hypothetical protein ABIQ16_07860 [Polyangiaceae bacterium]
MTEEAAQRQPNSRYLRRLLLCPGFIGEEWRLPVRQAAGTRLLVAWSTTEQRIDAGVPDFAAEAMTNAWFRSAAVTYPIAVRPPTGAPMLPRKWQLGRHFEWATARSAMQARTQIFDADYFSWAQEGQVVILSPLGAPLRATQAHLEVANDPTVFEQLASAGALGVVLPGVDGQVAGLYSFTAAFERSVCLALEAAAAEQGAVATTVTEHDIQVLLRQA